MVDRWECINYVTKGYIFIDEKHFQPSFDLILFLFQVLQQLRRRLSDWWGKERCCIFAVIYHKNNDSSNISLPSCSNFLFSVSLFVCLCAQSLSRERSWSPQSLGRWWSSRTRSVSSRWAVCFPFPLFSKKSAVVSAPTSHLPYLERHCLVLFESDLKNKRRWKRGFKLPKAWPPGQQHVCFSKSVQNWNSTQLILNRTKFPLTATFHIFFFF